MVFKNEAQLRKFLMSKCAEAVSNTEQKVHGEFAGNLNRFYEEYDPELYIRTGALFDSLESTGVKQYGNSVEAEVYFDSPSWVHGWVPLQNGDYGHSSWSDKKILDVVMTGGYNGAPHGGYAGGTAIWNSSMRSLGGNRGIKNLLIQELKKQGL